MAGRKPKIGLEYYSVDTDRYQDKKIKKLKQLHGASGVGIYDYILCEIYRDRGYFIDNDADTVFNVAEYFQVEEQQVQAVIESCLSVGLFNPQLAANLKVLTSHSIQERYLTVCQLSRRKMPFIPEEIRLRTEEIQKTQEKKAFATEEIPQSKVKESKGKEEVADLLAKLTNSNETTWHEALMMKHGLANTPVGKAALFVHIEKFLLDANAKQKLNQPYESIRSYFGFWVRHNPFPGDQSESKKSVAHFV